MTQATDSSPAADLGDRLKNELARYRRRSGDFWLHAQSSGRDRLEDATLQVRESMLKLLDKLRAALNVPTREEVLSLASRLDALDAKLSALEAARAEKSTPRKKSSTVNGATKKNGTSTKAAARTSKKKDASTSEAKAPAKRKTRTTRKPAS